MACMAAEDPAGLFGRTSSLQPEKAVRCPGLRPQAPARASGGQTLRQKPRSDRIAVFDAAVPVVEELEEDFLGPDLLQLAVEGDRPHVEVELVSLPGVEVDGTHGAQLRAAPRRHAYRVPFEPALPDIWDDAAGIQVVGGKDRTVWHRRKAPRHRVQVQQDVVAGSR